MTEHEKYLQTVWSVCAPVKEAMFDALRHGISKDKLAVGMTRSLYEELKANTNTEVWSTYAIFGSELKGSGGDTGATMYGMPILIPSYADNARRCWLMQEIELYPTIDIEDEEASE